MSDLSHGSSRVKINDPKHQRPCVIFIYSTGTLTETNIQYRSFLQIDCFSFSKYTANNNREPVGKSEGMKNAKITSVRRAKPLERIPQQTLSLGTLKWL